MLCDPISSNSPSDDFGSSERKPGSDLFSNTDMNAVLGSGCKATDWVTLQGLVYVNELYFALHARSRQIKTRRAVNCFPYIHSPTYSGKAEGFWDRNGVTLRTIVE